MNVCMTGTVRFICLVGAPSEGDAGDDSSGGVIRSALVEVGGGADLHGSFPPLTRAR